MHCKRIVETNVEHKIKSWFADVEYISDTNKMHADIIVFLHHHFHDAILIPNSIRDYHKEIIMYNVVVYTVYNPD